MSWEINFWKSFYRLVGSNLRTLAVKANLPFSTQCNMFNRYTTGHTYINIIMQLLCANRWFDKRIKFCKSAIAVSLSLSWAQVERLFSHLKLTKSDWRASLGIKRVNQLLNIKLNMEEEMWESIKYEAAIKLAILIQGRLRFHILVPVASSK